MRLYIPELIKDVDKILYLDSDIVVIGSLQDLFDMYVRLYYALVVMDLYVDIDKSYKDFIDIGVDSTYFNSGMMLINNNLCINNSVFSTFYKIFKERENTVKLVNRDQCLLNYIFKDKVKIIDRKWNFFPFRDYNENSQPPTKNEAVIIHFVAYKPWKDGSDKTYFVFLNSRFQLFRL